MKRALHQIYRKLRITPLHISILSVLFFANVLSISAQLTLPEGGRGARDFGFRNNCREAHRFRIKSKAAFFSFAEATDDVVINGLSIRRFRGIFDASGLTSKVYTDKIVVKCLDCKKEQGCETDEETVPLRLTVVPRVEVFPQLTPVPTPIPTPTPSLGLTPPTDTPITGPGSSTPTDTPDDSPVDAPVDSPVDAPDTDPAATPAPAETPSDAAPLTESPTEPTEPPSGPSDPAPPSSENSQNAPLVNVVENNNLTYAAGFFAAAVTALLTFILISAIFAKKLFNKWKYGANAANLGALKRAVKAKEKLAKDWMRKRRTKNIHAIGVGKIDGTDDYCIQVFVEDSNGQMLENPPVQLLPERFRQFPIFIFEMPRAVFLTGNYGNAKDSHKTIIGGISGANTNLSNEYGTIGYFCSPTILRPVRKFRKDVFLLSNAHVFANLSKPEKTAKDLIQQPSPGENKRHDFIASLENFVPIKFDNDTDDPNYTDAAIAKLFPKVAYKPEIPVIGKVASHVAKERVEIRQKCRKFGRTTGYTEGSIFSIHLSIWIKYGSTGGESFFKDQFLIVADEKHDDFVRGGDSGSLLVDNASNALGLIFAGGSNAKFALENLPTDIDVGGLLENRGGKVRNYGVANPISGVLKDLNVKLHL